MLQAALLLSLLSLSPLATDAVGVPRSAYWVLSCMLMMAGFPGLRSHTLRVQVALAVGLMLTLALGSMLALGQARAGVIPFISFVPLCLLLAYPRQDLLRATATLTRLMLWLLGAAWLGFAYYNAGGPALLAFNQYDGRVSELYLSTLSVTVDQGFMRPSALFDEPGALSFVTVTVACLRMLFGLPVGPTLALLVLGLVTGSFAHIVACALLLAQMLAAPAVWRHINARRVGLSAVIVLPLLFLVYEQLIAPRLVTNAAGDIEGDTRTPLILRSLLLLDEASPTSGLENGLCYFDSVTCVSNYGIFMESPFGPYLALGVPASLPYYLFLALLLLMAVLRWRQAFIHLTIFAIFLQRPYVMSFGYSTLAALYLAALACPNVPRRAAAPLPTPQH